MYDFAQPMAVELLEAVLPGTVLDEPKESDDIITLQNVSDEKDDRVNVEVTADFVTQEFMVDDVPL